MNKTQTQNLIIIFLQQEPIFTFIKLLRIDKGTVHQTSRRACDICTLNSDVTQIFEAI